MYIFMSGKKMGIKRVNYLTFAQYNKAMSVLLINIHTLTIYTLIDSIYYIPYNYGLYPI